MEVYKGKSVYKGIAMGSVIVLKNRELQVERYQIQDTEAEIARADAAGKAAKEQLEKLYDKALGEVGEADAAVFQVYQMMLEDEAYLGSAGRVPLTARRSLPPGIHPQRPSYLYGFFQDP